MNRGVVSANICIDGSASRGAQALWDVIHYADVSDFLVGHFKHVTVLYYIGIVTGKQKRGMSL